MSASAIPFQTIDQQQLMCRLLEELSHDQRQLYDSLTPHERSTVDHTLMDLVHGDPRKYKFLWEVDFLRKPMSVEKFIEDPDYFGPVCRDLYPCWRRELELLFDTDNPLDEILVTGAIGTGKTTYAVVGLAYRLYWLTCLRNPFQYYGLMEGTTSFVFGLFNATRELSANVHVSKILGAFNSCKYFRWLTQGTTEELEKQSGILKFPNNIKLAFGSRALHALGQDIIGGLLDEMNFTILAEQQQALDLYRNTKRRIMSRFPPRQGRKSPGLLFLVSSRKGEEDFLDVHIRQVKDSPNVRVISYSMWEAKGHIAGMYSGLKFRVMVGDDRFRSRVLDDSEPDPEGYRVVEVPIEHKRDFEIDCDGALMDIAGIPIKGGGRPLISRDKLYECIRYDQEYHSRKHPFKLEEVYIGLRTKEFIENDFNWQDMVDCIDPYRKIYRPKVNPTAHRVIHLDPATTGDCAFGFAMGHIAGRTKVLRRDANTMTDHEVVAPVIYLDVVLGIRHPKGDEVDFAKVRSFILFLRKLGFPITKVTADQFQSADTLQIFKKLGYETKRISLDLKPDNYGMFRQCIHEGRMLVYEYAPFVEEAIWLQIDPTDDNKVYALPERHKDISDAVAGVVASIMEDQKIEESAVYPIQPQTQEVLVPRGSIDLTGEWLLEDIPGVDIITGVGR